MGSKGGWGRGGSIGPGNRELPACSRNSEAGRPVHRSAATGPMAQPTSTTRLKHTPARKQQGHASSDGEGCDPEKTGIRSNHRAWRGPIPHARRDKSPPAPPLFAPARGSLASETPREGRASQSRRYRGPLGRDRTQGGSTPPPHPESSPETRRHTLQASPQIRQTRFATTSTGAQITPGVGKLWPRLFTGRRAGSTRPPWPLPQMSDAVHRAHSPEDMAVCGERRGATSPPRSRSGEPRSLPTSDDRTLALRHCGHRLAQAKTPTTRAQSRIVESYRSQNAKLAALLSPPGNSPGPPAWADKTK